ncbi:Calx-beta domain-containing protein, partial [Microcoleus sp. Pol12A5]|uniref:Calx-beta domain-containing protein n=1 Tax=Microcoleus sp. Pol12A5 TaxID=3055392 RepID=UPI002FD175A4
GTGGFSSATNFSVGTNPSSLAIANFNADDRLDIAVANRDSNNVSVLLNSPNTINFGAATFSGTEGDADTVVNIPVTISGGTPFGDVIVPIAIDPNTSATQNSDYTLSPTSLTFPASGTSTEQNIPVAIKPDNLPENDETAILNLGAITDGIAGTTKQTTLTIAANGTVSYAIAADTASIAEGNSGTKPLTFTATRSGNTGGASSVNYAIAGTATNSSDYNNIGGTSGATAVTGTINFAADETSKTITLDVLGDTLVEPDETIAVTLSNPTSPGITPTITTASATTTITNDDKAGFTINPTALTTNEVGGTATFTVKLNSQPTADVTIGLRSDNVAEGTVSTESLTFTTANYNQPQTITISGVDDLVADGPLPYKIVTAAAVSTDVNYNNLDPEDVTVTNSDNETPGITVNPTAGLTTGEDGTPANFTVVLNTQPTADVTIGLSSDNVAEGTVSPASITFTPANWNTALPITVTGVNDSIVDGDIGYQILTAAAVSTDGNYNNRDVADVSITNKDNDTAGISITPTATIATEGGANGSYGIQLTSQPIAPVTIYLTTGNQIQAIAPLTFNADNWNVVQPVTVKAVDDTIVEGAHSGNITHNVSSTDAKYNGIGVPGVTVAIADNDTAPTPPTPTPTPVIVEPPTPPTPTPTPVIVEPPTPTPPTPTPTPVIVEPPTPTPPTPTPVIVEPPTPTPTPVIVEPPTPPTPTPTPVIVEPPTPPIPPTPPAGIINTQNNWCGLEAGLNKLENILDDQLNTIKLPIVGSLKNIAPNFIDSFKNKLVDAVKNGVNQTTDQLETTLGNVLGSD